MQEPSSRSSNSNSNSSSSCITQIIISCAAALGALLSFWALPISAVMTLSPLPKSSSMPLLVLSEMASFLLGVTAITPFQIAYGYLYGAGTGFLVAMIGYTFGCIPPFVLAPRLAPFLARVRDRCQRLLPGLSCHIRGEDVLDGLNYTLRERPLHVCLSLRLNPIPPAGLTSYALGLTGVVPLHSYVLGSALGTMAVTGAEVAVGHLLTSLETLREGHVELSPRGVVVTGVSLAVSIGLCLYLAQVAASSLAAARMAEGRADQNVASRAAGRNVTLL